MRKLKLTPLFLLASVFGLSACTLPSWLSFLSFIPGLEAPQKEEKQEERKEEEEEDPIVVSYTAEKAAEDTNAKFTAAGYPFGVEWDDEAEAYFLGVSFGEGTDESEATLKAYAKALATYLPDYMEVVGEVYGDPTQEGYYDFFGDQSIYYLVELESSDEKVVAYSVSYVYEGEQGAQLYIFDAVEE